MAQNCPKLLEATKYVSLSLDELILQLGIPSMKVVVLIL